MFLIDAPMLPSDSTMYTAFEQAMEGAERKDSECPCIKSCARSCLRSYLLLLMVAHALA